MIGVRDVVFLVVSFPLIVHVHLCFQDVCLSLSPRLSLKVWIVFSFVRLGMLFLISSLGSSFWWLASILISS
ncbi:hypothetical protein HID58_028413, partial [Brassica napus]